ncbi:hypothetical protein F0562_035988 [Nyssa sinensis]|uniref:Uncharacterized protein n=1 Tax=Nyssa sinensis TaxID=561372 RepID=A0A5J5ACF3_9ASTE|nr:hypothetical protein F0562_035988 [Nyssa sinensis]
MAERKTKKRTLETDEFNCNVSDDETSSDSDDASFGKITLKQLKERCKTKKRKVSKSADLTPTQDYSNLQLGEDEFDLKKPLSFWKSKLSKNLKVKRKFSKKSVSTSSEFVISVKSEHISSSEESPDCCGELPNPVNVKVEVPGPEYFNCENMNLVADDYTIGCTEQVFLGSVSDEIVEAVESVLETGKPIFFGGEGQTCVVNEVSYDYLEQVDPISFIPSIGREAMEVVNQEKTCQQCSVLPVLDLTKEVCIKNSLSYESSPETTSPTKDQCSDMCNISQNNFCLHEISPPMSHSSRDQVPDMAIDNSLCCMELGYIADSCMFTDDVKEDFPSGPDAGSPSGQISICSSSQKSNQCLNHNEDLVSVEDGSPPTEEKQQSISINADAARNCSSPDNNSVSLGDGSLTTEVKQPLVSTAADAETNCSTTSHPFGSDIELSPSAIKRDHHLKLWHPPGRLLSNRKAISPTSQERLCQAMESVELNGNSAHYKCREELCFGKQTENKVSSAEADFEGAELTINPKGAGQVNRIKLTISPKQTIKKPKNGSPLKGIVKDPRLPRSLPHVSTGCTSIQNCSESAIAFSQRQMQDIDCLATKLMKELKFMKDLVEENLDSEAYPTTSLKYHEVKTAIKNATKLQETSRKWLSMMARDCSRFCKIMRLTEKGTAAPESALHKERKKITFADEAGGMLCHVKFFEDGMASQEPESDNQEIQVK